MKHCYLLLLIGLFFVFLSPGKAAPVFAGVEPVTEENILADQPVISYTPLSATTCIDNGRTLSGVTIADADGIPLTGSARPRIYFRKNSGSWFSRPGTNTGGSATNSIWAFSIQESMLGGVSGGDIVSYYIIAEDLDATPEVSASPGPGLVATGVNSVSAHPTAPNSYRLRYSNLSGTYSVGTSGNFKTLTEAVDEYNNACSLGGPIVFSLLDDSYDFEVFPVTITNHPDASPVNNLTIRPHVGALPVITGSTSLPILTFNAARYITIDGRAGGTGSARSLLISNSGSGVTVLFTNDAKFNKIAFCQVKGQRQGTYSGTVVFAAPNPSGTGNDNNTIDNNDISAGIINPGNAIYCVGTDGRDNSENTVSNNLISDYYMPADASSGVFLSNGASNWLITGNRFFQTAARLYTAADVHSAITVTTGTGHTISNNIIGFEDAAGNGTMKLIGNSVNLAGFPGSYSPSGAAVGLRFTAINLALDAGNPSNIDGNIVSGIAMYTGSTASANFGVFSGIAVTSGRANIGVNAGNTIGKATGNNSLYIATVNAGGTVIPLYVNTSGASVISNNLIGGISASGASSSVSGRLTGINAVGTGSYLITNNSIGNAEADNLRIGFISNAGLLSSSGNLALTGSASLSTFKGILCTASNSTLSITNNIFSGWVTSCANTTFSAIESSGAATSPGLLNINNNIIGTSAANWINALSDINVFIYAINLLNTNGLSYNINSNKFEGSYLGNYKLPGLSWIRLSGATLPNAVATINNNIFKNINIRINNATVFGITANYSLHATGSLKISGNHTDGNFTGTGSADYRFIQCIMTSAAGARAEISGNDFSNVITAPGFTSKFLNVYTSFSNDTADLDVSNNVFSNWNIGPGVMVGIDLTNMAGTAACYDNRISDITTLGDIEGISTGGSQAGGVFTFRNNTVRNISSVGPGGYIYGISGYLPTGFNDAEYIIERNTLQGFASTSPIAVLAGVFLSGGRVTVTVTVNRNRIGDFLASGLDAFAHGINNNRAAGSMFFTNNIIGDLKAPQSQGQEPSVAGIRFLQSAGNVTLAYNTIHLQAAANSDSFSTAAVFTSTVTPITLRNNILNNLSAHGSLGRTVAYWRATTNTSNYEASSDNNSFFAGVPGPSRLIFFNSVNGDQTLAAFKSRMAGRDSNSISVAPVFISTAVTNAKFLHLDPNVNCAFNAKGNNAGLLIPVDFEGDARATVSPFVTDIGADEISDKHLWTGAISTAWNNPANWSESVVPNSVGHHVIISPVTNQPAILAGETFQVASISLQPGAMLKNNGTLKVSATVKGSPGSINNLNAATAEGSFELGNSCDLTQVFSGSVFINNAVKDFIVGNTATLSSAAGEGIDVYGALSFNSVNGKTLFTGNNLTIKSGKNATGRIADLTGNAISGEVIIERYINTGLVANGEHAKGWQFLSTPTKGQTIFQAWQENGAVPAGYGTIITGTGSGFDITTAAPSIKTFEATVGTEGNWVNATSTNTVLHDQRGHMIFVRGDRSVTTFNAAATPTILRSRGSVFQPSDAPPATSVPAARFTSIGNPYASALDLVYMRNNGLLDNINNDVVVWDPLLYGTYGYGGYQTLSAANDFEPTAGGTAYYPSGVPASHIQSGQAFFVHGGASAGSVTFTELCKSDDHRLVNRIAPTARKAYFRATLFTQQGLIADGNAVVIHDGYRAGIDADDAIKMMHSGENFSVKRNGKMLSVDARPGNVKTDTIFYFLSNLRQQAYEFRFAPKNFAQFGFLAVLVDKYLHTESLLSSVDSSFVSFNITSDFRSAAADRFYIVFRRPRVSQTASKEGIREEAARLQPIKSKQSLYIFPNPVDNKINIYHNDLKRGVYQLTLRNAAGQQIIQKAFTVNSTGGKFEIPVPESTPAGVYNLVMSTAKGLEKTLVVLVR